MDFLSWKKSGCISMLLYRRGNNNESVWSDDSCTWSHPLEWIVSLFGALDVARRRRVIVAHRVVKELPIENTVWFWGNIVWLVRPLWVEWQPAERHWKAGWQLRWQMDVSLTAHPITHPWEANSTQTEALHNININYKNWSNYAILKINQYI